MTAEVTSVNIDIDRENDPIYRARLAFLFLADPGKIRLPDADSNYNQCQTRGTIWLLRMSIGNS